MDATKGVLFFDTETTGLPAKGAKYDADFMEFPHMVSLAWSLNGQEYEYIIKPNGYVIPQEVTEIHGISHDYAMEHGINVELVLRAFFQDAIEADFVCAHNIYFDVSIIKASVLRSLGKEYYDLYAEIALDKAKRIDTMMKTIKFVGALYANGKPGKFPKLEELYQKLFPNETFNAHNALEDVRALVRCLPELVRLGIIELKLKEYPIEPKIEFPGANVKANTLEDIPVENVSKIEFSDTKVEMVLDVKPSQLENLNKTLEKSNKLLDEDNF